MPETTPFADVPTTPQPVVAQVLRQLRDEAGERAALAPGAFGRAAERAVRELWDCPVRTFVPILALRQAREDLGLAGARGTASGLDGPPRAGTGRPRPPARDVLSAEGDVLVLDERDAVPL